MVIIFLLLYARTRSKNNYQQRHQTGRSLPFACGESHDKFSKIVDIGRVGVCPVMHSCVSYLSHQTRSYVALELYVNNDSLKVHFCCYEKGCLGWAGSSPPLVYIIYGAHNSRKLHLYKVHHSSVASLNHTDVIPNVGRMFPLSRHPAVFHTHTLLP